MKRRDILKTMAVAGATLAAAAPGTSQAQVSDGGPPRGVGVVDIPPLDPKYFAPNRLKGKRLVITGCARGLGRAAAIRAAREGALVVGVDWLQDAGRETAEIVRSEGGRMEFVHGDIAETITCDRMVETAARLYGGLDGALNNAGVMDGVHSGAPIDYANQKHLIFAQIHEAADEYWDNVFRTNSTGMFRSLRAELRQLVTQRKGGSIVNVGSIAGLTGLAGNPAYVASKHAVNGLTRNAAVDYAPYGIRVNSVNMAATDTPMVARAGTLVAELSKTAGPSIARVKTNSILSYCDSNRRPATVWEQVAVMMFLLSDEASNLTGALYATDGGWTAF
jgi:NAD(P)-dependent dehydrogenase (short-subunit alcohol dehydrogenase family)